MRSESLIIPITANLALLTDMIAVVASQTGDDHPFFCPKVVEGKPYEGHAHTFPPAGVSNADSTPIELK